MVSFVPPPEDGVLAVPENHTADNLGENLKSALADWGLDEHKLDYCITTDNGANNLGWQWPNCFVHNLQLDVPHGLGSHKEQIGVP